MVVATENRGSKTTAVGRVQICPKGGAAIGEQRGLEGAAAAEEQKCSEDMTDVG